MSRVDKWNQKLSLSFWTVTGQGYQGGWYNTPNFSTLPWLNNKRENGNTQTPPGQVPPDAKDAPRNESWDWNTSETCVWAGTPKQVSEHSAFFLPPFMTAPPGRYPVCFWILLKGQTLFLNPHPPYHLLCDYGVLYIKPKCTFSDLWKISPFTFLTLYILPFGITHEELRLRDITQLVQQVISAGPVHQARSSDSKYSDTTHQLPHSLRAFLPLE